MSDLIRLRNTNPLGAVDVPILGRTLAAGEVFDCPADIAGRGPYVDDDGVEHLGDGLLAQLGNYETAPDAALGDPALDDHAAPALDDMTVGELRAYAAEQGVNLDGATRKAEIVEAITAAADAAAGDA